MLTNFHKINFFANSRIHWILFLLFCTSFVAQGQSDWNTIAKPSDSAVLAGRSLANKTIPHFQMSKLSTVLIDESRCTYAMTGVPNWCQIAIQDVLAALSRAGITFLLQRDRPQLQQQIMEEQEYQQFSLQVDLEKAVELGKQSAVQAILVIASQPLEKGYVRLHARVIDIEKGIVSHEVYTDVGTRSYRHLGTSAILTSTALAVGGLAIGYRGFTLYSTANKQLEIHKDEPAHIKSDWETHRQLGQGAMALGAGSLLLAWYLTDVLAETHFEVLVASTGRSSKTPLYVGLSYEW